MNQKTLFDNISAKTSRLTAHTYSTSFSLGIQCLEKSLRNPIYSIYGFVRFADEIVDTFHEYDKRTLLQRFREDTWRAIDEKISLNPILNSFQATVIQFNIEREIIDQFLSSMEMDLIEKRYSHESFEKYIRGSAEVVGLMCLRVFCAQNESDYQRLKFAAMKLGAAFQKINFLRDMHADYEQLGRTYFPEISLTPTYAGASVGKPALSGSPVEGVSAEMGREGERFNDVNKKKIEESITIDLQIGYEGIKQLPRSVRFGVYVAYLYYKALFRKIRGLSPERVLNSRVTIGNRYKLAILGYSFLKHRLNLI